MKKGMLIKSISLCLSIVMLLAIAIPQGLSVFASDNEFVEDIIFFNNDGGSSHGSSGAGGSDGNTSSWTLAHNTSNGVIKDPEDSTNNVVSVMIAASANPNFGRGNNIRFENHGIISERVYFPNKISEIGRAHV